MKVYIVTEGQYSDYHIEKVFLDKNEAYKYMAIEGSYSCQVEEYEITDNVISNTDKSLILGVCARFTNDELNDIHILPKFNYDNLGFFDSCNNTSKYSKKYKPFEFVKYYKNISLRENETIDDFEERAKKICIDEYFIWKHNIID